MFSRVSSLLLVSALLVGCAGRIVQPNPQERMPDELPAELVERFEVKEVGAPSVADLNPASPVQSPASNTPKSSGANAKAPSKSSLAKREKPAPVFAYPSRRPARNPIWVNERHHLEMMFMGLVVGDFDLHVQPLKQIQGRTVYPIRAYAESSSVFSLFYKIEDYVDSYWDYEGLFSHRFQLTLNESKQARRSLELNDSEKKQSIYWNKVDKLDGKGAQEKTETFALEPFSQDTLSAIFWMRLLPLENGKSYSFPVITEGKTMTVTAMRVDRQDLSTAIGTLPSLKVKIEVQMKPSGEKKGEAFFWFSDDDRRRVLRFEAKVRVGSIAAVIKKFEPGEAPLEGR